jgi:hypothetical protein
MLRSGLDPPVIFDQERMSQVERFAILLRELERVGVDPGALGAGLPLRQEDVLDLLAHLPDGAGEAALRARLEVLSPRSDGDGATRGDARERPGG